MIIFMDSNEKLKEVEKYLDPQLWHVCAGGMVQMPFVNDKVFYFPQGHAEHACGNVNFRSYPRVVPFIPCKVCAMKYMADPKTNEVFANMRLVPVNANEPDFEDDGIEGINGSKAQEKLTFFAKTLTQSDANNGGGFFVPQYFAKMIFLRLDYSADPPSEDLSSVGTPKLKMKSTNRRRTSEEEDEKWRSETGMESEMHYTMFFFLINSSYHVSNLHQPTARRL